MENNLKLSAPWVTYVHELTALFEQDPEVKIQYNENQNEVELFVSSARKSDALTQLLPTEKEFGNVKLKITVVPANDADLPSSLFAEAFYGNPVVKEIDDYDTVLGHMSFVVFEKKVVQFFNDQLDDINGNKSTLYQDIAKDVFEKHEGVYFCTAADGKLSKPLGEWP